MNILFTHGLVGRGGDAVQVQALADALLALGHDVESVGPHTLAPYKFGTRSGRLRSFLRRLPWWGKDILELGLNLRTLVRARRILRRGKFDYIFHRAGIYDFVEPWLARSCPVVAHLDAPFGLERAFHGEGHFASFHRKCMRRLGKSARLVVTMSDASRDYYTALGIPREKVLVVPNGISSHLLRVGEALAEAHPPLSDPHICTIGFVGSLSRWHRVDLLLEAMTGLDQRFRAIIVGYGAEHGRLHALAQQLGVEDRVSWLGAMPHELAVREIARFDIAVLPGTLPTGAPMKLFEYAAFARPTIAPDFPNLRALFGEDEMRFVTPESPEALADAVRSLCAAPEDARRLGFKAQQRVREYTWGKIVQQILDVVGMASEA